MSVLGRSSTASVEQLSAVFNTNITSVDQGKVVYYDGVSSEFKLLASLDLNTLSNNLVGVISVVAVDGDGLGAQGSGFVVIKGTIQKAGATAGQVYFLGTDGGLTLTPPASSVVRVGYSRQNNFLYVDIDPQTIQIASLADRLTALETTVQEIADQVLAAPVYDFAAGDDWSINIESTQTNFGLDDSWTEGVVEYNTNFGADDNWAELIPE